MYNRHDQYWLTEVLVAQNCVKKLSINIYFSYIRILSRFWGKFSCTALVCTRHFLCQILLCTNAVLENVSKKIIFLDDFFIQIYATKKFGITIFWRKIYINQSYLMYDEHMINTWIAGWRQKWMNISSIYIT